MTFSQIVANLEFPVDSVARLDRVVKHGWTPEAALREYKDELVGDLEPLVNLYGENRPKTILDIGCGLAGITAALTVWFDVPLVHLVDGDPRDLGERTAGFKPAGKPWNAVQDGAEVVKRNAPETEVLTHYAGEWIDDTGVDLVVSFKSWCFHYPAEAYLRQVQHVLRPGGLLVVDIRKNTDGAAQILAAGFRCRCCLDEVPGKRSRFAFERMEVGSGL